MSTFEMALQIVLTFGALELLLALFRIIEPVAGTIFIDAVDISKIGLHDCEFIIC